VSYAGQRALVLGAGGFIGRHVAEALAAEGAQLILSDRSLPALTSVNVAGSAERIACDVMSSQDVADLLRRVRPSFIFNLAGYGVNPAQRDETIAHQVNAELPGKLAELSESSTTLIHVGSALEYGTASGDLNESTVCTPTTLYGQTKLAGTLALRAQASRSGQRAVTARLFTVYGPGEIEGRLLPALIATARDRKPLPITDGSQRRDFTYVGDVVQGLLKLGVSDMEPGEVVNLATGRLDTVRNFVQRSAQVLGIDEELLQFGALPTRAEEMSHDPVSIRRLRELTGWTPATSIEEGVRLTAAQ
jgi:UDP-glucose 4-epimerase